MSKKIKDLFINGMYESILNQKIDEKDGEDILYKILSFEAIHKYNEALDLYYENRKIVENWDLISSSKALLYLLVYFKKFDKISEEEEYFRNLPYVNQQTEEYLNSMDAYVNQVIEYFNQNEPNKEININTIKSMLYGSTKEEKLEAIKQLLDLESQGVRCDEVVYDYLTSTIKFDSIFSILLEYAMLGRMNKRITFKKDTIYYSIIPSEYTLYMQTMESIISSDLKYLSRTMKNISVYNYVSILYRPAFIYLLPEKIEKDDLQCLLAAIIENACDVYGLDPKEDNCYQELKINTEKMPRFRTLIKAVENEF